MNTMSVLLDICAESWGGDYVNEILGRGCKCCRCGQDLDATTNPGWHSLQILEKDGVFCGVIVLGHCRDCDPSTLVENLHARGVFRHYNENWEVVQGMT